MIKCCVCQKEADYIVGGFSFCSEHDGKWLMGYGKSIVDMRLALNKLRRNE